MSDFDSLAGDSNDADQPQEGNRPAQNARLTTPGHLSNKGYQGGDDAGDFLGLGDEVGGGDSAFELMSDTGVEPEAAAQDEPQGSAWVETGSTAQVDEPLQSGYETGADVEVADDVTYDDAPQGEVEESEDAPDESYADEAYAEEGYDEDAYDADEDELHGSWSESEPKRGGSGKLVGAVVGVLVVGALGVAGMKFMGAAQEGGDDVGPMASRPQSGPATTASVLAPVEDQAGDERVGFDESGEAVEGLAGLAPTADGDTALDAEAARDAFEAERGDQPPTWFDSEEDSQAEPAETGWTEEAEAVTRASTFVGDPTALLAMDTVDDTPTSEPTEDANATEVVDERPTLVVLGGSSDTTDTVDAPDEDATTEPETDSSGQAAVAVLLADEQPAVDAPAEEAQEPVAAEVEPDTAVASATSDAPQTPEVVASAGDVGPAAPTGVDVAQATQAASTGQQESRAVRNSTLAVEDVLLAPTMDSSNLRQANAKDLKGVWNEESVPMEALGNKSKVLTPNVGRVRVVLKSKDIFEGKLYAVGLGSVWLESEYGRISVDGKRIATVSRIDTKEGTPALGDTGSQNMAGLEKVRVKTPGGTFYGKVISRDDKVTTLITEDGAKLTLANGDVEFLTDAPKVTIGGKVGDAKDKGAKTDKKP